MWIKMGELSRVQPQRPQTGRFHESSYDKALSARKHTMILLSPLTRSSPNRALALLFKDKKV